jgi:hypothetical protein
MRIADISLQDVRAGKNWRVLNFEALSECDLALEMLEIEPLGTYGDEDALVYSGLTVHLENESEPLGQHRPRETCVFAPEAPSGLLEGQVAVVLPLLMVKVVSDIGWDYCEYTEAGWRQLGLTPNPDAPLTHEYLANPAPEDAEFSIELTPGGETIGDQNRAGFALWARFLGK